MLFGLSQVLRSCTGVTENQPVSGRYKKQLTFIRIFVIMEQKYERKVMSDLDMQGLGLHRNNEIAPDIRNAA